MARKKKRFQRTSRQFSLLQTDPFLEAMRKNKPDWLRKDVNKASLHLLKKVEVITYKPIQPYDDKPLFYGLPTMSRWRNWEQSRAEKSDSDTT